MADGVTIVDPETAYIDSGVTIGRDTVIYPNTVIESGVKIGSHCAVGPFTRLRAGTELGDHSEAGNFVELVRTTVGRRCKIKHHAYLGDALLGDDINVGAGTITANYDGKNKHVTKIGNRVFLGVGSILIAPVRIGDGAVVGAGSVVTKRHDIPDGATVVGIPARVMKI
jgi:bifunctional UDP-N-acetylglucosamine pyrophosphorylase/glucosamine-1-phosphate N-acetyltransferase